MKVGGKVKVIAEGPYEGQTGFVVTIAKDAPKYIGVRIKTAIVWFRPAEVEKEE